MILHHLSKQQSTFLKRRKKETKEVKERKTKKASMAFSSIPFHVDPSNWNQQQPHAPGTYTSNSARSDYNAIQLPPIALTTNPVPNLFAPEPTSLTTDQIRLPRLPHPESGLKCPRCDSTNTKFCYFNNNSVSQPRHFCRTCRRYWTRGGTLRNVPVGGGSRRNNKRQKPTSSNAPSARTGKHIHFNGTNIHHVGISSSLSTNLGESNVGLGLSRMQMQFQQIPFTGAFQTTDVLPIQLGASSYLGLSSKNEGLLGFCTNTNGTGMASNGGGSQASLPSFNSSSCGNAIPSYSLFN